MRHIFNLDSPLMQALSKLADFILLNLFMIVSSIPVVTIGTAMTALYDVTGKMARGEDVLLGDYWKAFKSNLRQGIGLWLLLLLPGMVLLYAWMLVAAGNMSNEIPLLIGLCIASALYLGISAWVFPMQARFINSVGQTLKNAVYCGVMYLPRTILLTIIQVIPFWLLFFQMEIFVEMTPIWIGLWFSLSAYLRMLILKKPFQNLEKLVASNNSSPEKT